MHNFIIKHTLFDYLPRVPHFRHLWHHTKIAVSEGIHISLKIRTGEVTLMQPDYLAFSAFVLLAPTEINGRSEYPKIKALRPEATTN